MAGVLFEDILKFNPYHDRLGRFASADGAASFTYAPGKSKAHDMAIAREKDRMMRKEFGDKIGAMVQERDMTNSQNCVEVGKVVASEIDRRFKEKKKAGETDEDQPQTEDIYDVLRDCRKFGLPDDSEKVVYNSELDDARTKAIIKEATDRFPSDWYDGAFDGCGVTINDSAGRAGHYVTYGQYSSQIQVYARESASLVAELGLPTDTITNLGIANSLTHELGHYFERTIFSVGDTARNFYNKRTKNSETVELYPGEYSKPDRFADEYMGKIYSSGATEIISVLSQKMGYYNPKSSITTAFGGGRKDIQSYNFILGLMAGGGKL